MADKRNIYLDADDSDEDVKNGYESEEDLRKTVKRAEEEEEDSQDEEDEEDKDEEEEDKDNKDEDDKESSDPPSKKRKNTEPAGSSKRAKHGTELPGVSRPLTRKNLVASEKAVKRSGVVYLSRVPPFMKPVKLRSLLAPYGAINRIFLSPEDPQAHARRVRAGGNKKRSFVDGWIEFVRKRDAKRAVELLNGHTLGGKKSSYYRDDLWNLVYLRGFKWHHLTEQIAAENAERASRMRAEIAQTTRENKEFVRNVERAKMLEGIEAKRAKKGQKGEEGGDGEEGEKSHGQREGQKSKTDRTFHFRQTTTVARAERIEQPEEVRRVLGKIF